MDAAGGGGDGDGDGDDYADRDDYGDAGGECGWVVWECGDMCRVDVWELLFGVWVLRLDGCVLWSGMPGCVWRVYDAGRRAGHQRGWLVRGRSDVPGLRVRELLLGVWVLWFDRRTLWGGLSARAWDVCRSRIWVAG